VSNKTNTEFGFFIAASIVGLVLILAIDSMVGGLLKGPAEDMSDEAIAARIAPVGQLNTGPAIEPVAAAAPAPAAATSSAGRSGEEVYNAQCAMCHATGAAGAPKLGSAADWGPRAANGMSALMNSAINGKGGMPARGLCGTCSDGELEAAVKYMVNNSK